MKKTAVVFGATGLVGKALVAELLSDPNYEKVITPVRRKLLSQHARLEQLMVTDFAKINDHKDKLKANDYYCCVGTTIKKAGTQAAFSKVDLGIPVSIASLAKELSVPNLIVISSVGANSSSSNFYLRTKGEMEKTVKAIYSGNLKFIRPSLLIGHREEYRFGERMGVFVMKAIGLMMIGSFRKYRGIRAEDVAKAMISATKLPAEKVILEYDELI